MCPTDPIAEARQLRVATIVGARPQFVKAAVVQRALSATGLVEETMIHTGQHYDEAMSDIFFHELRIAPPKHNLAVGSGLHGAQTAAMLSRIEEVLLAERPDWVLVFGDTNSTLAGALAAAKMNVPVAHVEAGLRSFNRRMPEEVNRVLTDHVSSLLFAPTPDAVENLRREGLAGDAVHMVGDVMLDAVLYYGQLATTEIPLSRWGLEDKGYAVCTLHRQENTDDPTRLSAILEALVEIGNTMPIALPLHPRTAKMLGARGLMKRASALHLMDPVSYLEMQRLVAGARVVLTDSGGLQKEAFFHRVPCVTLRDETEWVETVSAGWNRLAGASTEAIVMAVADSWAAPQDHPQLYGDGRASEMVANGILGSTQLRGGP